MLLLVMAVVRWKSCLLLYLDLTFVWTCLALVHSSSTDLGIIFQLSEKKKKHHCMKPNKAVNLSGFIVVKLLQIHFDIFHFSSS